MSQERHSTIRARAVGLLAVVACIAAISALLIAAQRFAAVSGVTEAQAPAIPSPADAPVTTAQEPPRPVRDVTPDSVARVYMPPPAPTRRKPATSIRITQAGVKPDGSIVGDGGTVRLYGVAFPDPKRICRAASGENWPCGRRAYITLHNRIAAETVTCEPRAAADPPAADCFVGNVNLAAWLLGQGLARLASDVADESLVAAEAGARKAKLGLWEDSGEAAPVSAHRH
jgi:endonuclease YncB( thermonuclease family)